jgi:hypothetical protein
MTEQLYACLTKQPTHEYLLDNYKKFDKGIHNIHNARAAFLNGVTWTVGKKIKIAFMKQSFKFNGQKQNNPGYTLDKAKWVEKVVEKNIVPLVNLSFEWDVSLQESDVRISFVKELGSFSYVGTQAMDQDKSTITMNLGWLDKDVQSSDDPELAGTGVVIIHEFGHLLGMIHEHSRADAKLEWNKPVVYSKLGNPPNNWDRSTCDTQIFHQYALSSFNGSVYDPHSVMHYWFPDNFFKNDVHLTTARGLSNLDKIWINKKYPGKPLPENINTSPGPEIGTTNNNLSIFIICIGIIFLIIITNV